MEAETAYVVFLSRGEYSDRQEYAVCVFGDEQAAQSLVRELDDLIRPVIAAYGFSPGQWEKYLALRLSTSQQITDMFPHLRWEQGPNEGWAEPEPSGALIDADSKTWLTAVPIRGS